MPRTARAAGGVAPEVQLRREAQAIHARSILLTRPEGVVMAKMVRTRDRGIYQRGSRYVVVYYVHGKQRKEAARSRYNARVVERLPLAA